ncbi:MAG: hypothetical protein HY854_22975 [Burkholderiales bacterium]|nr:hypothetical protein [Burkholderiales bacterium]
MAWLTRRVLKGKINDARLTTSATRIMGLTAAEFESETTERTIAPNLLQRQFEADAPNRRWLAGFTYIWTPSHHPGRGRHGSYGPGRCRARSEPAGCARML